MPKKLLRLIFSGCLLFNSLNLSAFAQELPSQAQVVLPEETTAAQEASQPKQPPLAEVVAPQPAVYPAKNQTEEYPFAEEKSRAGFRLFEPSRYEFMKDDKPLLLPPAQDEGIESGEEEYYRYSRAYLENIMRGVEGGVEVQEKGLEYMELLNPSLLLPVYGTTISLTGRKTFGLKYDVKKYKTSGTVTDKSYSNLDFEQEMQMKVQGKISDRIFVDIDYDDQREDAQNISVGYRGKGEEFVQSADFGDIELSLPGTEFVSYSKQVFGAKMHMKYGGANLRLIGSSSKGESRSKQFKGDSVFETVTLKDIQYTRRKYYDLTFGCNIKGTSVPCDPSWQYSIANGTEKIYLDDHTTTGYQYAMSVNDMAVPTSYYPSDGGTAAFKLLTRGVDYSVDYNNNIIIFTSARADTDVIAVNYKNSQGVWAAGSEDGTPKIIKTSGDRYIASADEIGYRLEIKRYYNIGTQQITRDDGQGNFILKLLESDGKEVCSADDTRGFCQNTVDYDKGTFLIAGRFPDQNNYNTTPSSSANRNFFVQFTSTVKTYFLEPDIVVQSEKVSVNGATMARNKDYYVDYSSGFITFYNNDLIGANSVIDVSYEVSSGGTGDSMLLGSRFNYDFTKNITVGASILNQGSTKPTRAPNVGSLPTNLTVMETDFKAKDVEVADGVKLSLGAEAAESRKNENLFGYALIDNLEETKIYVKASTVFSDWKIASNPTVGSTFFDAIKWDSQSIPLLEINKNAAASSEDKQNVLVINYDFSVAEDKGYGQGSADPRDEVSIVYPLSNSGVDLSEKTLLELSMLGEENGPQINISFGSLSEMSDEYEYGGQIPYVPPGFEIGDIIPTCSKYYSVLVASVPKTEDLHCNGALTAGDDVGWVFVNPDGTWQRYNPFANNVYNKMPQPNGIIDTQDLNANGLLDSYDASSGGDFGFASTDGTNIFDDPSLAGNTINYSGWKQFQRQLDFSSEPDRWSAIKQVRITLKRSPTGHSKGQIKIANLAVSGSTWQPLDSNSKELLTYGINNEDNPSNYKPIFNDTGDGGEVFKELYGSISNIRTEDGTSTVKEQSLALQYDFSQTANSEVYVQQNFTTMDFSQHKQFRFLLYNPGPADADTKFFLRIATDDSNYSEAEIPLDFSGAWHVYSLKMIDTNDDGVPERWESNSKYDASVTNEGYLNYKRISTIKVGVRNENDASASGTVWLDDIFLTDSITTVGRAYMGEAKIAVDNWLEAGGKVKYMDDKFQTPVSVSTKQKNTQQDYYLKFNRIKTLPVSATYYKSNTVTPDVLSYDTTNTVSLLDAGEVNRDKGSVKTEYVKPSVPRLGVEYNFENASYSELERNDAKQTYSATLNYSPAVKEPLLKNISAGASYATTKIDYSDAKSLSSTSYYDTKERAQSYNLKFSFMPWLGTSVVPSYSLTFADEDRHYYDSQAAIFRNKKYDKYASQTAGFTTVVRIAPWLAPSASYNVSIKENNNLSQTTFTSNQISYLLDVGTVKSVTRSANGSISLSLNGKDILKNSKLFSTFSLSGNYKLQDGDSWENVDASENMLDRLWLRSSLGLKSPYTYRNSLTLRDTYSATARWSPFKEYTFEGSMRPVKTISLISNFSRGYQTSETLSTGYKTRSSTLPDVVFFIDELEKVFTDSSQVLNGTNLKLKYNLTKNETVGAQDKRDVAYGGDFRFVFLNTFDTTLSYTRQTMDKNDLTVNAMLENYLRRDFSAQTSFSYKKVRFTPKVTYLFDTKSQTGDVLVSRVEEISPSLNIRADFNLPFSLALPLISRQYLVTNRVVWNTTFTYSRRRSYTVEENRNLYNITTNFDYEISKNLRLTLTAAFEKFDHLYIAENSYIAYNVGTLLTLQF